MIPYDQSRVFLSPPDIGEAERKLVDEAILSNWAAPIGPDLDAFEAEIGEVVDRSEVVALASGTAAIHLALIALGIGPGDRVAVATFTFAASANPVVYVGAEPYFIDADPATWNMSPELLREGFGRSEREGRPIRAVIAVDLYGQCADYAQIALICEEYGAALIEDSAEALGAYASGRPAGSFGQIGIFSFNGNKIITTSGGGALVTDDARIARQVRHLATQAREPVLHYEHRAVGYNYRLSNLLAAFGRGQLATLGRRVARRQAIAERYADAFADLDVSQMPVPEWSEPNWWLSTMTLNTTLPVDPSVVVCALDRANIESRPVWKPLHLQPVFAGVDGVIDGTSEGIFRRGLCLPSGSSLSDRDQERVIDIVHSTITGAPGRTEPFGS